MIVARYGTDTIPYDPHTAITVGTFDGVHIGHCQIINKMNVVAKKNKLRTVVVTFDPHPQIVLAKPDRKPLKLLTTIQERCVALKAVGVTAVVVLPFSREFAATPAKEFIENVIVKTIGVQEFFLGHDHMFGKDRGGNEELLVELSAQYNFSVTPVAAYQHNGLVVSSTKIRTALEQGDVKGAAVMLGRAYSVSGRVVRGDGRGRTLGFPTANIVSEDANNKLLPSNGVYAVTAIIQGKEVKGMANIGVRPTFVTAGEQTLEVHFFDFDKDLYDSTVSVEFHEFIRTEQKFGSKEEFLAQLDQDQKTTQLLLLQRSLL